MQQAADARLSLGGATTANRPNIVGGVDLATAGGFEDRLASADHPTATWVNPEYNIDAVVQKDLSLVGPWKGQLRLEVLNVLNRPNVRALQGANTVGSSNFGQTNLQSGFMRILQFSFRMSF